MTALPEALEALCITGGPRSGKTGALVERAAAWTKAAPASPNAQPPFLFFCASPVTIDDTALRLSLRGLVDAPAEAVELAESAACQRGPRTGLVTTPFDYACRILADPRAQRATGRGGRVLSHAEEAVFYEDLKTCGLKRRRLRELWAFLQCGLANLNDSDPNWIQTTEEQAVLDLARDILAFEGAILPGEVVNLAVRALEAEPTLRQRFGSPVVLADDYLLMSRASQRLVSLLATAKIAVAGSEDDILPAFEPYPCTAGFAEFEETYSPLQRVALEAPFPTGERAWKAVPDLSGEMLLIAQTIADELTCGTDPRAIAVVGTNRIWRTNLQRALASVGIPAAPLRHQLVKAPKGDLAPTSEDDREHVLEQLRRGISQLADISESCPSASTSNLATQSNPPASPVTSDSVDIDSNTAAAQSEPGAFPHAGDSVAWRQWLSFDDALGRSAAVSELQRIAQPQGLNLAEALAALNADALPGLPAASPFAQSLLAPYRAAQRLLEKGPADASPGLEPEPAPAPTRRPELESAAKSDVFSLAMAAPTAMASSAAEAAATSATPFSTNSHEACENDPIPTPEPAASVTIAAPEDLFGHTFDVVIFGGFVNGFIPSRDMCDPGAVVGDARTRQEAAGRAALALAEQRATRRLLFTSFESCDLETAERLRLHIPRIRLRDGVRTCDIKPSSYLQELNLNLK